MGREDAREQFYNYVSPFSSRNTLKSWITLYTQESYPFIHPF